MSQELNRVIPVHGAATLSVLAGTALETQAFPRRVERESPLGAGRRRVKSSHPDHLSLRPTVATRRRVSPLDPVDRNSPLGQPGADLPPQLGLPSLPGVHALLGHHELHEVIAPHRLDQPREVGARTPQFEQERFCGDTQGGGCGSGQPEAVRDTLA